jgi:sucrose-6F-phosphate phosphohydrolase
MPDFLLCTDLDRTLLPNGEPPESPEARHWFSRIASRDDVHLAYVTGRDRSLVAEAIDHYQLPTPDWLITDVGASLYRFQQGGWDRIADWDARLERCWRGRSSKELADVLTGLDELILQEPAKQGRYKLSFYHPPKAPSRALKARIQQLLNNEGLKAKLVFSIDEAPDVGLLDILPAVADKLQALRFLIEQNNYRPEQTLFAGDSGNDLEILASEIPSVIVANALRDVIQQAKQLSKESNTLARLYVASGGFQGMNGNYSAGIMEGLAHFHPRLISDLI